MITKNAKGEYALYDQGQLIGYAPVEEVHGIRVLRDMKPKLVAMIEAAEDDGVTLTLQAGHRTWEEQYNLRKAFASNKLYEQWCRENQMDTVKSYEEYLTKAKYTYFNPYTAKPGWSNHQDGKAYDFKTKDAQGNVMKGEKAPYTWLVKNAHPFGFVRTVVTERWHWEYLPGVGMFNYVPKTDVTWDGLVN